VSWDDFTDNTVITASAAYPWGMTTLHGATSGTGATSFHANSIIDTGSFGVRVFTLPSTAGYYNLSTDAEAWKTGVATVRLGARVKIEDVPVSGGEDYYYFMGISTGGTSLPASNFAVLGIRLTDHATNFVQVVDTGGTPTTTNTGVAFAADTWVTLEIELSPSRTRSWINGTEVASVAVVPAANSTILVSPFIGVRVGAPAATRNIYYDWAYIAYKNPNGRGAIAPGGPF
jgi:hypothetical protein